jgi:hypothetical protein
VTLVLLMVAGLWSVGLAFGGFLWRARSEALARRATRAVSSSLALLPVIIALAGAAVDTFQWSRAAPIWLDEEMIAINIRDRSFTELAGPLWLGQSAPYGWLASGP